MPDLVPPHLVQGHHPLTDLGNSERLMEDRGADLRHVSAWGWLHFDGSCWRPGNKVVRELAKETVRRIYTEAQAEPDDEIRKALAQHAIRSERVSSIKALIDLASSAEAIRAEVADFDVDPMVLNVLNGTIDLRSGRLREHRREDLITKLAPVDYEPGARSELWGQFLNDVTAGKPGFGEFLRRLAGYCLTGEVGEEVLPIAHGPGGRGKTTFLEALSGALGGYAGSVRIEALTDAGRFAGGHNDDIARLVGVRLVSAVEASEGSRLREGLVKSLTGGDVIPASRKNKPGFEFHPQFKLILATNEVPRMRADDSGMQRRVVKLPFTNAPSHVDPQLKVKLRQADARAAILAWAVGGCLEWQADGLKPPECVTAATEQLWHDLDQLAQFFEQRCVLGDDKRARARTIRDAYESWCDEQGVPAKYQVSQKRIADWLNDHDCVQKTIDGRSHWLGVGVVADSVTSPRESLPASATEPRPTSPTTPPVRAGWAETRPVGVGVGVGGVDPGQSRNGWGNGKVPQTTTTSTDLARHQPPPACAHCGNAGAPAHPDGWYCPTCATRWGQSAPDERGS